MDKWGIYTGWNRKNRYSDWQYEEANAMTFCESDRWTQIFWIFLLQVIFFARSENSWQGKQMAFSRSWIKKWKNWCGLSKSKPILPFFYSWCAAIGLFSLPALLVQGKYSAVKNIEALKFNRKRNKSWGHAYSMI